MNDERQGLPSASKAERFVHCAVSHQLEQSMPPEENEDPLATDGTIVHAALETEDGSELTMTQAEIFEKLKELDKELYRKWREDFPVQDKGQDIREERLFVLGADGEPTGSAKADHVYIVGSAALNIDAKTGFKQVQDSSRNWQGRLQAIALYQNNPELENIRVAFAQFRMKRFFTYCDYTKEDLEYALTEWNQAVWRSKQPDASATPGPWCSMCRARSNCKAAAAMALIPSAIVNGGSMVNLRVDKASVPLAVASLTLVDLKSLYERRLIISGVMEAVKERIKALPDDVLKQIGYERKPGARYTTKVEINPLFQLLWDDGFWNHIPEETRHEQAIKEFSQVTTALTGKLEALAVSRWTEGESIRFKTVKDAKAHLKDILAKVSTTDVKEPTIQFIRGDV